MPHEHELRPAIEQAIEDFKVANVDKVLCAHDAWLLLGSVFRVAEPFVVGVGGDDAAYGKLVADVEWAVETYLVPWDVPFLNRFVEKFVDANLVSSVRPMMDLLRPAAHPPTKFGASVQPSNEWRVPA